MDLSLLVIDAGNESARLFKQGSKVALGGFLCLIVVKSADLGVDLFELLGVAVDLERELGDLTVGLGAACTVFIDVPDGAALRGFLDLAGDVVEGAGDNVFIACHVYFSSVSFSFLF